MSIRWCFGLPMVIMVATVIATVISTMAALFRMTSASPASPTSRNKNASGDGEQGDDGH